MKKIIFRTVLVLLLCSLSLCLFACNDQEPDNKKVNEEDEYVHYSDDEAVDVALNKTNGFIKGVCHPNDNYSQIADCNIEWIRVDIPYLYDDDGNISQGYISFKNWISGYVDKGFKVMAVTPYPSDYIKHGLDIRNTESWDDIQEIAKYYVNDLKGLVGALQITNEMGIDHFTYPLTLEEAVTFIGIQMEAIYPIRGDILVGYNCAGLAMLNINAIMKSQNYLQYADYVGVDVYLGCFESVFKDISAYNTMIKKMRVDTGKPIILCEFGYIGLGARKTAEEKAAIMKGYGYDSEAEAKADIDNFVTRLTPRLQEYLDKTAVTSEDKVRILFETEMKNHIYLEIQAGYELKKYAHTWEGQAQFFTDVIRRLMNIDYLLGAFIYCYSDSDTCYICGQSGCPVETAWGLVDKDGKPKPSWYAVQGAFQ